MPVPVTEQEMKSPMYKYFERDMTAPDPARFAEGDQPMPTEKAL